MAKTHLVVGFIRGAHGFSGECRIESASGDYEHLLKLKEVELRHDTVQKKTKVEYALGGSSTVYVKFEGIKSSEEIKKYNEWEILVPRKFAKPLKKGEWYVEDLKECSLVWNDDSATSVAPIVVGNITDVLEGGAGYLLEVSLSESCTCIDDNIKFDSHGKLRTVLVPFNEEHVGKVDMKEHTVQLMHLWILE